MKNIYIILILLAVCCDQNIERRISASGRLKALDMYSFRIIQSNIELDSFLKKKYPEFNSVRINAVNAISQLSQYDNEMITLCGGILPNSSDLANPENEKCVATYCFENNQFRNQAAKAVIQTLKDFEANLRGHCDLLKTVKTHLIRSHTTLQDESLESNIFNNLNANEAALVFRILMRDILTAEYQYMMKSLRILEKEKE